MHAQHSQCLLVSQETAADFPVLVCHLNYYQPNTILIHNTPCRERAHWSPVHESKGSTHMNKCQYWLQISRRELENIQQGKSRITRLHAKLSRLTQVCGLLFSVLEWNGRSHCVLATDRHRCYSGCVSYETLSLTGRSAECSI